MSKDIKFKTKIAKEALTGKKTIKQISEKYKVHPTQVSRWRNYFLNQGLSSNYSIRRSPQKINCANCGIIFYKAAHKLKAVLTKDLCCSRKCRDTFHKTRKDIIKKANAYYLKNLEIKYPFVSKLRNDIDSSYLDRARLFLNKKTGSAWRFPDDIYRCIFVLHKTTDKIKELKYGCS